MDNSKPVFNINFITRAALIAALYAALTMVFAPISYLQVQVRIAEALTVLAYIEPAAILGLFIGCVIANLQSPLGPLDVIFGSTLTLMAALATYKIGRIFSRRGQTSSPHLGPLVGLLPPVIFNAFGVALILNLILELPYFVTALYVGFGQILAVYGLGYPLLIILLKRGGIFKENQ